MLICSQLVFERTRVIENNQQLYIEKENKLELFEAKVVSPNETFPLHAIHDVSFRKSSEMYGMLYLHTHKGVRAYMVKEDPSPWMKELKACLLRNGYK